VPYFSRGTFPFIPPPLSLIDPSIIIIPAGNDPHGIKKWN